jgi:hypothetical protein
MDIAALISQIEHQSLVKESPINGSINSKGNGGNPQQSNYYIFIFIIFLLYLLFIFIY